MEETQKQVEQWIKIEEPHKKDNSDGKSAVIFWNPAKNISQPRVIEGILIGKTTGKYGQECVIKTKDGDFQTPAHTVLISLMELVAVGQEVRIIQTGQKPSTKGKDVIQYQVETKKVVK